MKHSKEQLINTCRERGIKGYYYNGYVWSLETIRGAKGYFRLHLDSVDDITTDQTSFTEYERAERLGEII